MQLLASQSRGLSLQLLLLQKACLQKTHHVGAAPLKGDESLLPAPSSRHLSLQFSQFRSQLRRQTTSPRSIFMLLHKESKGMTHHLSLLRQRNSHRSSKHVPPAFSRAAHTEHSDCLGV